MTQNRIQQTVVVTRLLGPNRAEVPTLISVDRIITVNADPDEPHCWLKYEVEGGAFQNWRVTDSLTELHAATNGAYDIVIPPMTFTKGEKASIEKVFDESHVGDYNLCP